MSDVLLHEPPASPAPFVARVELETAARAAMGIDSPWLVPVRSFSPVIHAAPPPAARPGRPLTAREAAIALVELCDVVARAHARGWAGLSSGVDDVRLVADGEGFRVAVVLPHLSGTRRWWHPGDSRVRSDLRTAVWVFVDLATGAVPTGRRWDRPGKVPAIGDEALRRLLQEVLDGDGAAISNAASLAAAALPLAPEMAPIVEQMPRVSEVRTRHDWDRLVDLGEAALAARPGDRYLVLPLSSAYHQRAVERRARGELQRALADLDRAVDLDAGPRNHTTRAMVLRDLRDARAGEEIDRAIAGVHRIDDPEGLREIWVWRGNGYKAASDGNPAMDGEPRYGDGDWRLLPGDERADLARALYVRAVWRFEQRDLGGAAADIDLCEALIPEGPSALRRVMARALVPIRRAELREAPSAGTRWNLVRALVEAGRSADARREAELLAGEDAERYRRRCARLLS